LSKRCLCLFSFTAGCKRAAHLPTEEVMAVLNINGNLIIDEAASLQTSATDNDTGVAAGADNEVAWSTLLSTMSASLKNELTTLGILPSTGEASGDASAVFPQAAVRTIGNTASDFVQVGTNVTDLQ